MNGFPVIRGFLATAALLWVVPAAQARTWTDQQGRSIDAEIVRVENDAVVVSKSGKELRLRLAILSDADKDFVTKWNAERQAPITGGNTTAGSSGELELNGTTIERGSARMTVIEKPFSEETIKRLSKNKDNQETALKMAVAVPKDFDPAVPQKYYFVVTAVNNEAEGTKGNIGKFGMYAQTCLDAGWACVAVDSNIGRSLHTPALLEGLALLEKEWPGFKASTFATGGHSGGAKACWWEAASMVARDLRVSGVFMSCCNQDYSEDNRKEAKTPAAEYKKIRCFLSTGKNDGIATIAHSEVVMKSLKSNGFRQIRNAVHEGGHALDRSHFADALKWFAEPDVK